MRYGFWRDLYGDYELDEVGHRDLPPPAPHADAPPREDRHRHRALKSASAIVSRVPRVTGDSINLREGKLKLFASCLGVLCLILVWRSADAMTVTPANPSIGVGQTQQFTANGALTPTAVAAGGSHTCMRLPDGTVQCWGRNDAGQLGDGDVADPATGPPGSSTPVQVSGITGAAAVIAGGYHTCALFADGTAWCWGRSDDGQLGNGARASASTPVPVTNLT